MAVKISSNAPIANVESTYVSGSGVRFSNFRYTWSDLSGLTNTVVPLFTDQYGASNPIVNTNMPRGGQIEKGRNFDIKRIGLRLLNKVAAAAATPEWYNDVLASLFRYSMLQFKISGTDQLGQFPLALLLPTVAAGFQAGNSIANINGPMWIDLGENNIILSEQVDFRLELIINIPSAAAVNAIPAATEALFMLQGTETFAQL